MLPESIVTEKEVCHVTSRLEEARRIIRENAAFRRWLYHSTTDAQGTTVWKFLQYGIVDDKLGTKPTNYSWIFSYNDPDSEPDFTLSAITVVNDPDSWISNQCQAEVRIRLPLSDEEKQAHQFESFGKLGVCIGLRLPDGSMSAVNSENLKPEDILVRAQLVVETFIAFLNSRL